MAGCLRLPTFYAASDVASHIHTIRFIHSGRRRDIDSTKRQIHYTDKTSVQEHVSSNEMDTHANTCCLGKNFVPLYYTGEVCNVHAYSDELDAIKDVPIGAGATLWTNPKSGNHYILEFHQALMFTDSLAHSLINPNHIRYDGHSLCDDPWDRHRSLGLVSREHSIFIPFTTRGTVISFDSRVPTADELHTLSRVVLTDDTRWDPATVTLRPTSSEEADREGILGAVRTSRVSSMITSDNLIHYLYAIPLRRISLMPLSPQLFAMKLSFHVCVQACGSPRPNLTPHRSILMRETHQWGPRT
jgi:hypothetical protein